jgi:hypothetical protein
MIKKEEQNLQKLIISNLAKYFEKPVRHALDYNDTAIRDSVTNYFGGKSAVHDSTGRDLE